MSMQFVNKIFYCGILCIKYKNFIFNIYVMEFLLSTIILILHRRRFYLFILIIMYLLKSLFFLVNFLLNFLVRNGIEINKE